MSTDARNKLRSMGGIMASSPELMQVAQKFQLGGPVAPMAPLVGQAPFPPRPVGGPMSLNRAMGSPSKPMVPPLAGTIPLVPREMTGDPRRRALAGTAPSFGMGMGGGLGSFDPILEDDIDVDALLEASQGGGTSVGRREGRRPAPGYTQEDVEAVSPGRSRSGIAVPSTDDLRGEAQRLRERAEALGDERRDGPRKRRILNEAEELESRARLDTTDDARADRTFESVGRIVNRATPDPEKAKVAVPKITEILDKDTAPSGDGDGDQPAPKQSKRDLRSRYNEKLELFKEIYGTDDKDEAQDRAMSLAMIGLAIAAGQSPDALTNIAQGALAGLQGVGARREAERERERGLRTLALETAIGQQEAETEAEAEAAAAALEQANKLELEEFKARIGAMYDGGAGGSRDARNIIDFTQNTYTEALKAASAMTAPDFDPEIETPHQYAMRQAAAAAQGIGQMFPGYGGGTGTASPDVPAAPAAPEVPTITTREEYDALPSGAQFMQNGQMRRKP